MAVNIHSKCKVSELIFKSV